MEYISKGRNIKDGSNQTLLLTAFTGLGFSRYLSRIGHGQARGEQVVEYCLGSTDLMMRNLI